MKKLLFVGIGAALVFSLSAAQGFSQVPALQNRIPQQIVINGQQVPAAYVMASGGGAEAFSCPAPQPYVTPDGASQGWACYDPSTGVWLLNAVPPAQAQVAPAPLPQQPEVIYQQAPPTVIYQQAPVVYSAWPRRVAVAPAYPPSVALGAAVINAAGRIASAAIMDSHRPEPYHYGRVEPNRFARVEPNHFVHAEPNHFAHAESNRNRGGGHERHS
jgi:hypothetical protein